MTKKNAPCSVTEDQVWKAESDARTLIEAQAIRQDSARCKRAYGQLKKQSAAAEDALTLEQKVRNGLKAAFKKESY